LTKSTCPGNLQKRTADRQKTARNAQLPPRITRFNVTSRNHWEPINAWTTLLRASNQKP